MTEGEWARTTITVFGRGTGPEMLEMAGNSLQEQLQSEQANLKQLRDSVPQMSAGVSVRLLCSWTPVEDQRAMSLSAELVGLLAAVNGHYWMDVYPPAPME